jgi:hypothetical protein
LAVLIEYSIGALSTAAIGDHVLVRRAPVVYVATTALQIAGVIRIAVPVAKAAAWTGSLWQASFIVRLGDEEVDGEVDGLANVRRSSRALSW